MSPMLAVQDFDSAAVQRDVIASLSQSIYRSLPWPARTIDACVAIVAEADRMNNPRRVRAWIDAERAVPQSQEILGCLDAVLQHLTRPGVGFSDRIRFANKIRQDAVDYLRSATQSVDADATLDPHATVLADGMMAALRMHDPALADHSEATAAFAKRLAIAIGADAGTVARATLAARLHDIGKMRISRSILCKPMPLTAAERDEICAYPATGAETLAAMPALAAIAPIVASHRERVDGTGYPDGLSANEIPLESRIVAIADAYHSMTLAPAYRTARTPAEALEELLARSGRQFDAQLVTAFVGMIGYRTRIARTA
jgi:HD-GYP domain-containing protein (c-di-GMP phosphodiesterase class II)